MCVCPMEDGMAASAKEDTSAAPPLPLFARRRLRHLGEQLESDETGGVSLPPVTGRLQLLDLAATEGGFLPLVPDVDDGCSDVGNGRSIKKRTVSKVSNF